MSVPPAATEIAATASDRKGTEFYFDDEAWQRRIAHRRRGARWVGWRLRALVAMALLGCLAILASIRTLGAVPALEDRLHGNDRGQLTLSSAAGTPRPVRGLLDADGQAVAVDALALHRAPRWLVDDPQRRRHAQQHDALAAALATGSVQLVLDDGDLVTLPARARGAGGLGAAFWLASAIALLLYLVTMVVLLAHPTARNTLYAVMSLAQVGNLLLLAAQSMTGLGWPAGFMRWDHALRSGLDLASVAALVHVTGMHPRRLPLGRLRAIGAWLPAAALALAIASDALPHSWWWLQGSTIVAAAVAIAQLRHMQRVQPHPLAALLRRVCIMAVVTQSLLTLSIVALDPQVERHAQATLIGGSVWLAFVALMLLMLPFLARTQQLMREFSLLAAVSTLAIALDLLFVSVFSLGHFASLTLALCIALAAYAGLRQRLLNQTIVRERVTTERVFEHLYRMAREVQAKPHSAGDQLIMLLREVFEPLEVRKLPRRSSRARIVGDGANMIVPVPQLAQDQAPNVILLAFAQRGRRMFTANDARLADQVVYQLSRAVLFDEAVERGRTEERVRIAQDLHDDIGARLLTLMYQAPTREMEDYLRHTLKDLKTLTRGLAASSHWLSHAVAEWKADVSQRLAAADCEVRWSFSYDHDCELSVVQWSALTRVLRELVSNAIAHARATRIDIEAVLERGALTLTVSDDGCGRNPDAWSHGLGLGGVRKRVRQLGGNVQWRENDTQGIVCSVAIPRLVSDD